MNRLYELIEQKIKRRVIERFQVRRYTMIFVIRLMEEDSVYILLSKFEEDVVFEYHITVRDERTSIWEFNDALPEGVFEADFDA